MRFMASLALLGVSPALIDGRYHQLQANTVTTTVTSCGRDCATTVTVWAGCGNTSTLGQSTVPFGTSLTSDSAPSSVLTPIYANGTSTLTITSDSTATVAISSLQTGVSSHVTTSNHSTGWYTNTTSPVTVTSALPATSSMALAGNTTSCTSKSTPISASFINGTSHSFTHSGSSTPGFSNTLPASSFTISPNGTSSNILPSSSSLTSVTMSTLSHPPSSSTSLHTLTSTVTLNVTTSSMDSPVTGSSSSNPVTGSPGSTGTATVTSGSITGSETILTPTPFATNGTVTSSATSPPSTTCVTYSIYDGTYSYTECLSISVVTPTSSSSSDQPDATDSSSMSSSLVNSTHPGTITSTLTIWPSESTVFSTGSTDAVTGPSPIDTSFSGYPVSTSTRIPFPANSTVFSTGSTDAVTAPSSQATGYPSSVPTQSTSTLTITSSDPVFSTGSTDAVTNPPLSTSSQEPSTTCVAGYGGTSICHPVPPSITGASSTDAVTGSIPTTSDVPSYPSYGYRSQEQRKEWSAHWKRFAMV